MDQRRRIFIAINLPEDVKSKLTDYQKKIEELFSPYRSEASGSGPIRWTKPENLHITLEFLGYLRDQELVEICQKTKEMAASHGPFEVKLTKICCGPLNKSPRMIWAIGPEIKEISLASHITLGRIRKWEWQRVEPEERAVVDEDINLEFSVNSIEVMESVLKRGGAEYSILQSYKFSRGPTS